MSEKTTLPFMTQYIGGLYGSLLDPNFADAFQSYKPQMYQQLFGKNGPNPRTLSENNPIGLYTKPYDPWSYLEKYYGRQGGPNQTEQTLLNNSAFGVAAPINLGPTRDAWEQYQQTWGTPNALFGSTNAEGTFSPGLYGQASSSIFNALGGQIKAPDAPTLGDFQMPSMPSGLGAGFTPPSAPGLAPFQMPDAPTIDVPGMMQDTYQDLLASQPGLRKALRQSLDPRIALPGQTIDQIAQSMSNDAALKEYVDKASAGMEAAYEQNLNQRLIEMQSRFAGEGSYLSSPMFQGQGQLTADLTAQHLSQLGQMQLGAAEGERNRNYAAASQQYATEYQRNATQVQLKAQQAAAMAKQFGDMASQAASVQGGIEQKNYADQLQALSNEYSSQANYLASTYGSMVSAMASGYGSQQSALASMYGSQVGAAASAYGTQANFLSNIYNTGTNAALQQQGIAANATRDALQLLQTGQASTMEQALKIAQSQQASNQNALDKLYNMYYTPGQNAMEIMKTYFGLPTVSKSTGAGFDIGGFLSGAAKVGGLFV